ncbi:MAG: hypothetical protein QOE89_1026 [Pseudonocardiales bacterium]|nr:hypothetical protein [Pseudonocardiales bacterium]
MSMGVPARSLSDDDLRRELAKLKVKQAEIMATGTTDQKANHTQRTTELEEEFLNRFSPERQEMAEQSTAATDRHGEDPQPGSFPGAGDSAADESSS